MNKANNPANLKGGGQWKGMTGRDARGHNIYARPEDGARAAFRDWQSKWNGGKRTIREIIRAHAPKTDTQGSLPGRPRNDPDAQAEYIGKRCCIGPDTPLFNPAEDPLAMIPIMRALFRWEMGHECELSIVLAGAAMWHADFVEAKR